MWIKKLYATFGRLNNAELTLGKGLNIVCGGNESGKSTWSAFICAMLYGVSTREKNRIGYIADKEKFLPWNGSPMYGRMEVENQGQLLVIERTAAKSGVLSKLSVTEAETGLSALDGEDIGETLVGAAREAYERTAFIGQSRLKVDKNGEIERRILSAAVGEDDGQVSFSDVEKRLMAKKSAIRALRGGGQLAPVEAELSRIDETRQALADIGEALASSRARLHEICENERKAVRALAVKRAAARGAFSSLRAEAEKQAESANAALARYSDVPGRDVLDKLCEIERAFSEKVSWEERAQIELSAAVAAAKHCEERTEASPFAGKSAVEAERDVERDIAALSRAAKLLPYLSYITLAAAIGLGAFAALMQMPILRIALAVLSALLVLLSGALFLRRARTRSDRAVAAALSKLYPGDTELGIRRALSDYRELLKSVESARYNAEIKRAASEKATAEHDALKKELFSQLDALGLGNEAPTGAIAILRARINEKDAAYAAKKEADIRLEALLERTEEEPSEEISYTEDEVSAEDAETLKARCDEFSRIRRDAELALSALEARAATLGDDKVLLEKRTELSEKREALLSEYGAIELALEQLTRANTELRARFAPRVERRAAEIFAALTGGSFKIVRIMSKNFDMSVAEGEASAPRDILQLSQGTLDELWFSLRLALCETVLRQKNAPPMILDDAFINFDGDRLHRALDLLRSISRERQIILFTCHTREADYFSDNKEVNILEI